MAIGELQFPTQNGDNLENMNSVSSEMCNSNGKMPVHKKTNIGGVLSTPAVRSIAKQYGIDISDVSGSGEDGRVLKEDVLKYAADKGITNEAFDSSSIKEEFLGGEEEHPHVSAAYGWDCGDETILLR